MSCAISDVILSMSRSSPSTTSFSTLSGLMPLSSWIIFFESAATISRVLRSVISETLSALAWSCFRNSVPTLPEHPSTATEHTLPERVKAPWTLRRARVTSSLVTTAETWRSLDPWAMALMLTPAEKRALMKVAETPGVKAIPSPMMATTDMPLSSDTELMLALDSSSSNADRRDARATSPCSSGTTTQIECSEEAWVIMMMLTLACPRAPKNREATPGRPTREAPSRLRMATLSIDVIPLMGIETPLLV
mmetsp:Transcript_2989/g.7170  ORF Transcript_2989/g.7170 Transcript_2989/m.7170 type:complete len:250 (-) Transcript_2989:1166-1915(-)